MANAKDETGNRYGKLEVLRGAGRNADRKATWLCRCDCGQETVAVGVTLRRGKKTSCGCVSSGEAGAARLTTHGLFVGGEKHYLCGTWQNIKQRTMNPKNPNWERYGGRGIRMYEPWVQDFAAFVLWIEENLGTKPAGHSLDRINPNAGYRPGNLRWSGPGEQRTNQECHQAIRQLEDLANWINSWI